jgi:hypothetical protein
MSARMKVAAFTVKADVRQSARWKRTAEAEGFPSVGAWAALALDAYLEMRLKAGMPVPLAWSRGKITVTMDGQTFTVQGHSSPPFASWVGTAAQLTTYRGTRKHLLFYLPEGRLLATLESFGQCKALAAELARAWIKWGAREPPGKPAEEIIRAMR